MGVNPTPAPSLDRPCHEASQLYRGDFLEEETYSDWCSGEREYLREVYLSLLKRLAALCASWEDWEKSISWHRRALLVDRLREEVPRELMRCLWRAGRRDEALRQYLDCRRVLEREREVDPLPETEQLYRQILETPGQSSPALVREGPRHGGFT